MRFEIQHPAFTRRRLSVETSGGLFSQPRLYVDGQPVTPVKGKYTVASDAGADATIRFKAGFPDPIPKIVIDDKVVALAPPLKGYEQAWILLPLVLVVLGGAIGGLCGAVAATTNGRIFRGEQGAFAKYSLSALVTLAAVFAWLALAIALRFALGAPHR